MCNGDQSATMVELKARPEKITFGEMREMGETRRSAAWSRSRSRRRNEESGANCVLELHPTTGAIRLHQMALTLMSASSTGDERAMNILRELQAAEKELVGRAVVLTNAKAGTINGVFLDDVHGLRISISGHDGRWPISTVKHIEG
jgi:hypothetical protein